MKPKLTLHTNPDPPSRVPTPTLVELIEYGDAVLDEGGFGSAEEAKDFEQAVWAAERGLAPDSDRVARRVAEWRSRR